MKILDTIQLLKALADRSRIRIVNALDGKPQYVEELSERLNLAPSTVSFHLKKLEDAGLVHSKKEQYYTVYHHYVLCMGKPRNGKYMPYRRKPSVQR